MSPVQTNETPHCYKDEELTFIHPDDVALYKTWDTRAFDVQVANHELLGHGSGKLFQETEDGKKNFDPEKVRNSFCSRTESSAQYWTIRSSIRSLASLCEYHK